MDAGKFSAVTCHRVRWGEHEKLLEDWKRTPPVHPINPRYRYSDVSIDGRYSLFETIMNYFRDRGWLDAAPADFKWAELTVYYDAPDDPMDGFAAL